MKSTYSILLISILLFSACSKKDENLAKPRGQVRLTYPKAQYVASSDSLPYQFEYNSFSKITPDQKNHKDWCNIVYPNMKATLYLSYFPVQNNLDALTRDAQTLLDTHLVKATGTKESRLDDPKRKVYCVITRLNGETASNIQFHVTDSTKHFLVGSLYFKTRPQADSLQPAVDYVEKDVRHLLETLNWK